jgi:hypothetical protein
MIILRSTTKAFTVENKVLLAKEHTTFVLREESLLFK